MLTTDSLGAIRAFRALQIVTLTFFKKTFRRTSLWHSLCEQISCQLNEYAQKFLRIIPQKIDPAQQESSKDFSRDSKLPFPKLITFILSIVVSGRTKGVDVKSGEFFRNAGRSGLWPDAKAIHRSTLTKARRKVPWPIFRDILNDAVQLAYECFPQRPEFLWHDMSVYGVDGSKYKLPATDEIRKEFDPKSGLQYSGKGHYPMCLVSTVYDVFRRLPIARTVVPVDSSEREQAKHLLPFVPTDSVILYDRGFPSYELIRHHNKKFRGYYVFRCPAQSTFSAVEAFIQSGKDEDEIFIDPTSNFLNKIPAKDRKKLKAIKLRIIRMVSPDGIVSVLLTNLYDREKFPRQEIITLYFKRWEVESYYRDEKVVLEIEEFHGKTSNSIRQELFAAMIMSVISRTLMALSSQMSNEEPREPQFKNAIMTLASEAAVLAPDDPERAVAIFQDILKEIYRVKYYRPKVPRPSQPRVTKRSLNKWASEKTKKVLNA